MSPRLTSSEWEALTGPRPEVHLLQTAAWADFKSRYGWTAHRIVRGEAAAQVLVRSLPGGLRLAYIPKGPIGDWIPGLLDDLDALCREERVFLLTLEPDASESVALADRLREHGFRPGAQAIQPRRTILISLEGSEEEWLGRMHPKTRYNIHLAERKGVRVTSWDDLRAFGAMMHATAQRQAFGVHDPDYYRAAYDVFHPRGECELFAAEWQGQVLAALMVFGRGRRGWYFYGGSNELERSRMPTYLLQWEAMRWASGRGCSEYDLWGVPDEDESALEAQFASRSDGLWGVYRFKRGFGGRVERTLGAWDRPRSLPIYLTYRLALRTLRRSVY